MALVKIKMLDSGPNKNHRKGDVLEVDAARAALLIAGKHAEEVKYGDSVRVQKPENLLRSV